MYNTYIISYIIQCIIIKILGYGFMLIKTTNIDYRFIYIYIYINFFNDMLHTRRNAMIFLNCFIVLQ
jgi:hypothetical protein